jgi:uncharacterized repeat protein (TIGR02543 family)
MDGPKTATADWKTQYELTVSSAHDTATGGGWYDSGSTPSIGMTDTTVAGAAGTQYVFTGWSSSDTGGYAGADASHSVTMSNPITETAAWKTQYELTVSSAHDTAGGAGWYDAASIAHATLASGTVAGTAGTQYVFTGWSGGASGTGLTSDDITMDGPKTATADWKTQYELTVTSDYGTAGGAGWYDSGATPSATVTPLTVAGASGVQYVFTQWSGDASGATSPSNSITMDGPKTATADWKTQLDYLEDAKEELIDLRVYVQTLRDAGKIGQKEYEHFVKDLDKIQQDIEKAKRNLDTARYGYDDKIKGFEDLRHVVMKLEHVIKDVQDWLKKGKIAAVNANPIINELEKIRMKVVNKARAEALEEKALALKAIEEAKAAGKDTTKAEQEIAKVDQQLAKAEQKILQGKLAQAIQHFKHAFAHSDHAIKKAYDPKWTIDYKDWIDELEEMNP